MAESNYLEDRTVQLAKRVELLLNRLPAREQGQEHPPEATKLRQITSFNQSLAKELESIKAECQEKLKSVEERSLVISQETESLRIDKEALQKANEETFALRDSLQKMLSDASSERSLLADERKAVGCKATDLTQREQALQSDREQLERDRKAGDTEQEQSRIVHQKQTEEAETRIKQRSDELEQSRVAHDNKVKEAESRIHQQRDELEQSITAYQNEAKEAESRIHQQSKKLEQDRLAHSNTVAEDRARSQTQIKALDERQASVITQLEEIALQRQGLITEHQKLDTQKKEMLLRSSEISHRKSSVEDRERKVGEREERLAARQDEVTAKDEKCKDFIASHNAKVDMWGRWCADLEDKREQIDMEKQELNLKKGTISAIQKELTREREKSQSLRVKLGEAESKLAARGAEAKTQMQASAEHGKGLNEILNMLKNLSVSGTSMKSATDVIQESTRSVKKLEEDLSSKLMAHDAVEKELAAAQANIVELRNDMSARDETITRLEQQLSASHKEKYSAEEQLSALHKEKYSAEERVSALEKQLSDSEEQKTSAEQARQKTTHDLSEKVREIENLRDEVGKIKEQVQNKTTELGAATDQLKVLERDLRGETERAKSMAHYRVNFHVEEDRHKTEKKELIAEHQRQIQKLNAEHGEAIRALETRYSREINEAEGLLSRHQRTHRRSLPLLTPSTTRSASLHGGKPQGTSEWQQLLDEEPTQDGEAHEFLRSIEPSIADEDVGNFTLSVLLPHIANMAPNPTKRNHFEAYLQSNETDWFCFVLLGKLGHENQESRHAETRCTYRLHQENCIQVRLREDIGPRNIEFRTFHVE